MKKMIRKSFKCFAVSLIAVLASFVVFENTAYAADYYNGENRSHLTPSAPANARAEVLSSASTDVIGHYEISVLVERKKVGDIDHLQNYLTSQDGWKVKLANNDFVSYNTYSGALKMQLPSSFVVDNSKIHIGSNGVAYCTCSACGYTSAYLIDFTEYGYYGLNGTVNLTGATGYLYCPNCYGSIDKDGYKNPITIGKVSGEEGSYRKITPAGNSYQGVYVWADITDAQKESFLTTFDIGYCDSDADKAIEAFYKEKTFGFNYDSNGNGPFVDNSGNGSWHRWDAKNGYKRYGSTKINGDKVYVSVQGDGLVINGGQLSGFGENGRWSGYDVGVVINDPASNGVDIGFGHHPYHAYYSYINVHSWNYCHWSYCNHMEEGGDTFGALYYNGKTLGENGYGLLEDENCERAYLKGAIGFCADCGQEMSYLVYASPATLASVRKVKQGSMYYYFCPYHVKNATLDGKMFSYIAGNVEQSFFFKHACLADSVNQYYLQIEPNSPEPSWWNPSAYKVGGYFYQLFEDGKKVPYVAENMTLPYNPNVDGDIKGVLPTVKSKNKIAAPSWGFVGYIFDHYQVYNGSEWVDLPGTWDNNTNSWKDGISPKWKDIVDTLGENNSFFAKDGNVVRLRPVWIVPTATVKVLDGDVYIKNGYEIDDAEQTVATYSPIRLGERRQIANLPDKIGTVTFHYGSVSPVGGDHPVSITVKAKFSNLDTHSSNVGVFDPSTNNYLKWYCDTTSGKVKYVWMREQCDKLTKTDGTVSDTPVYGTSSLYGLGGPVDSTSKYHYVGENDRILITPNANIVPILSMAHDRYCDEWSYENYMVVEAYVYYMYALSHNTAHYDPPVSGAEDSNTYNYVRKERCASPLGTLVLTWDETLKTVNRPKIEVNPGENFGKCIVDGSTNPKTYTDCSNIYVHGYELDSLVGRDAKMNQLVISARNSVRNSVNKIGLLGALDDENRRECGKWKVSYNRDNENNRGTGLPHGDTPYVVGGASYDFAGLKKAEEVSDTFIVDANGRLVIGDGKGNKPPYTEYTTYCESDGDRLLFFRWDNTLVCDIPGHTHGDGSCNTDGCTHFCDADCYDELGNPDCDHECGEGCCDKQEHIHKDWESVSSPGCYDTVMVCPGHCGGHIEPAVNLAVTYTFEGLAYQDVVALKADQSHGKDASFMAFSDFVHPFKHPKTGAVCVGIDGTIWEPYHLKSVSNWTAATTKAMGTWFKKVPNGPVSAVVWLGQQYTNGRMKAQAWWSNAWHSILSVDGEKDFDSFDVAKDQGGSLDEGEDDYGFEGWFDPDDNTKLDEDLISELYDFYGSPTTFYREGISLTCNCSTAVIAVL